MHRSRAQCHCLNSLPPRSAWHSRKPAYLYLYLVPRMWMDLEWDFLCLYERHQELRLKKHLNIHSRIKLGWCSSALSHFHPEICSDSWIKSNLIQASSGVVICQASPTSARRAFNKSLWPYETEGFYLNL